MRSPPLFPFAPASSPLSDLSLTSSPSLSSLPLHRFHLDLILPLQTFFSEVRAFPLVPYNSHGFHSPVKGGKVVSDALMPSEYALGRPDWIAADFKKYVPPLLTLFERLASLTIASFLSFFVDSSYPEELKSKVHANWAADGFPTLP